MSRIVIIEDNPNSARMAAKVLAHAGHDVITAEDGENGLNCVLEAQPDLVLLDLGLPDIDGQTLVALMRQHEELANTRIVAFTAWPEDHAREMARVYGCDGMITKPIDTRTFPDQVAAFLSA
jgi:DNA-binding response OmpR family regulator